MKPRRTDQLLVPVAFAITLLYILLASSGTLWDRDEPRFARAVMEMIGSGNYLYPTFNGQLRPDKPILIYWLMAVCVRLLGPIELAFRLPSIIGMAVSCYLTGLIAKRLFCPTTGLLAMLVLATTIMALVEGSAATADGVLLACMMGAITPYAVSSGRPMGIWSVLLTGICLGLAMLTKGPVGLLPLAVILSTELLTRRNRQGARAAILPVLISLVIAIAIFLAWAIPANKATGGMFARMGLGHHVIGRSIRSLEGHGGRWLLYLPYYLGVAVVFLFPWSIHIPTAFCALLAKRPADRWKALFILVWICLVFLIMTLVSTKLPHYVLFSWPAFSIIVARTIVMAHDGLLDQRDLKRLGWGLWLFVPVAIAIAVGLVGISCVIGTGYPAGIAGAIVILSMATYAMILHLRRRYLACCQVLIGGMAILVLEICLFVMPSLESVKISPPLARAVLDNVKEHVPIAAYGYAEPTLNFYIGRNIEFLSRKDQILAWFERPGSGVLIIPQKDLDRNYQEKSTNVQTIATVAGYNYSKGRRMTVLAVLKGSPDG